MKVMLKWVLPALFIVLAFLNIGNNSAHKFLSDISADMLASQLLLIEIKSVATPLIADVPLLKDSSQEILYGYNKVVHYLTISNGLALLQIALLNLSRLLVIKILLVILFIGSFIPAISRTCQRWLIIGLFICPGLGIYINGIHYLSNASNVETGTTLKAELAQTHDMINAQKAKQKTYLQKLQDEQKSKHHGKLTLGDKIEDEIIKVADDVVDEIEKIGLDFLDIVKSSTNKLIGMGVQLLVNIGLLFLLLPLAYFYLLNILIKKFFIYNQTQQKTK